MLNRSGLLDVTMRTAELMRKNAQLAKELADLKTQAEAFVEDVLNNPENAHLKKMREEGTFNVSQKMCYAMQWDIITIPLQAAASFPAFPALAATGRQPQMLAQRQQAQPVQAAPSASTGDPSTSSARGMKRRRTLGVVSVPMSFEDLNRTSAQAAGLALQLPGAKRSRSDGEN